MKFHFLIDLLHSSKLLKDFMSDERKGPKEQVDVAIGMVSMWSWPSRYTGDQI